MMMSFNRLKRDADFKKTGANPVNQSFALPLSGIPEPVEERTNSYDASELKPEGRLADSISIIRAADRYQPKGGCGFATGIEK